MNPESQLSSNGSISDPSPQPPNLNPDDPLAPDAPIHHLLSLRHNPRLKDMTTEELTALVARLRQTSSPQALTAKLQTDSATIGEAKKPRRENPEAAKRKAFLDEL